MPPQARPLSTITVRSDVTIRPAKKAQAAQAAVGSLEDTAKASDASQLRIFLLSTEQDATFINRAGSHNGSEFYDIMKRALLTAVGMYLSTKGTEVLEKMATIWIKANHKSSKDAAADAKKAVKEWQAELNAGRLPPVIVSWREDKDGHTFASDKPPTSVTTSTNSLESMTITLDGAKCWMALKEGRLLGGSKFAVEFPVRLLWIITAILHEFGHTFEFFLIWFYSDSDVNAGTALPAEFASKNRENKGKEPEVGYWIEEQFLGGTLSNGDDNTGRSNRLRAGVPMLLAEKETTPKFSELQALTKLALPVSEIFSETFSSGIAVSAKDPYDSTKGKDEKGVWWEDLKKLTLTYNKVEGKANETNPGITIPEEVAKWIKDYQGKAKFFLSGADRQFESTSASRGHIYEEKGKHYISHGPGHKEVLHHGSTGSKAKAAKSRPKKCPHCGGDLESEEAAEPKSKKPAASKAKKPHASKSVSGIILKWILSNDWKALDDEEEIEKEASKSKKTGIKTKQPTHKKAPPYKFKSKTVPIEPEESEEEKTGSEEGGDVGSEYESEEGAEVE